MMTLRQKKLENMTSDDLKGKDIFVALPFLYEPILLELKKYNTPFKKMVLQVDGETYDRLEVITALCRLFGRPLEIFTSPDTYNLAYENSTVEISFSTDGERLSGVHIGELETLRFSTMQPYILRDPHLEGNPVIVLPEGDGLFYMELDKRESEEENRQSIIGDPAELYTLYRIIKRDSDG